MRLTYCVMYFMVVLPTGTKRCLLPFPVILINPSSKNKSDIFSETNSETRKPQLYKVSYMALLRSPSGVDKSIAAINSSISSVESVSGSFLPVLGTSINSKGVSFR